MPSVGIGDEIGDKRNGDDLTRSKFLTCKFWLAITDFYLPITIFRLIVKF
jgi:hypothetical protein